MPVKQKIVVLVGIVLVGLALLFPPSTTVQSSRSVTKFLGLDFGSDVTSIIAEFNFLDYENASYGMLVMELFLIGLTTGLLIYAFRPHNPRHANHH